MLHRINVYGAGNIEVDIKNIFCLAITKYSVIKCGAIERCYRLEKTKDYKFLCQLFSLLCFFFFLAVLCRSLS